MVRSQPHSIDMEWPDEGASLTDALVARDVPVLLAHQIDSLSDDSLLVLRTFGLHCPIRLCMGRDRQLFDIARAFLHCASSPPAKPTMS
jgi:hypothetical protein